MCSDNTHVKKQLTFPENDIHYPGQTSHDVCFIPECVRKYNGEPLYILVAHWCQILKGWIQRNQIAKAFHIPPRRASYLMAYLSNKSRRVTCESREALMPNNVYRYEIQVTGVMRPFSRKNSPHHRTSRIGNADTSQINTLWNQLYRQRHTLLSYKKEEDDND